MSVSKLQFDQPRDWQDFEDLCYLLWKRVWRDENAQKNGRQGQSQAGVDIFGRPGCGTRWAGVQCKGKDKYVQTALTKAELTSAVKDARKWRADDAKLSEFVVATTGPRDERMQELAREITEKHRKRSLFSVTVCSWPDILLLLEEHPEVASVFLAKHGLAFLSSGSVPVREPEDMQRVQEKLDIIISRTAATGPLVPQDELQSEYTAQLDEIKKMLGTMRPESAKQLIAGLKLRSWDKLEPAGRYRLTVQEAAAAWQMGNDKEAGPLLVRALEFNPSNDKALVNCALGHLMLGQTSDAAARAQQAIAKNSANCDAYGVLVQTSTADRSLDDLAMTVPEECRNRPAVAYALAHVARRRGLLAEAVRWFRTAIANDPDGSPESKADLGQALLEIGAGGQSLQLAKAARLHMTDPFSEARKLYEDAWNSVKDSELRKYNAPWLVNLGSARWMAGDLDGAMRAIDEALEIERGNARYIKVKAAIEQERGRKDEAIRLLDGIRQNPDTPEAALLLALLMGETDRRSEAIGVLDEFIVASSAEPLRTDAELLRARFLAETGDTESAMATVNAALGSAQTSIHSMVIAARVADIAERPSMAQEVLAKALAGVGESTSERDVVVLAEELGRRKQFGAAAQAYERIGANDPDSPLAANLLQCYFFDGALDKALELCNVLRDEHGIQKRISAMTPAILDEIGDLTGAAKAYEEYVAKFPDNFEPRIQLAHVNLRLGNLDAVDSFLAEPADTDKLSMELATNLAFLHVQRRHHREAVDILYRMRRKHYDNPQAHLNYWGAWMRMVQDHEDAWLGDVQVAATDTAVQVRDDGGDTKWYVIEDRRGTDIARGELGPTHALARALAGKREGDKVTVAEGIAPRTLSIQKVASKYVWAFNDTGEKFEWMFPGEPGIWRFHVDTSDNNEKLRQSLEPVLEQLRGRGEAFQRVERLYRDNEFFTVGAFANAVGGHALDVWSHLTRSDDIGLISFRGRAAQGRGFGRQRLDPTMVVIADAISLLTMHTLGVADVIHTRLGQINLVRSTVEMLERALAEARGHARDGLTTLGVRGNSPTMEQIPAEAFEQNVRTLETILSWIANNCTVVPVTGALRVGRQRRQELSQILGACFADTMLAAWGSGGMLFSDDSRLRRVALREHGVPGLWTQQLLQVCLSEGKISKEAYEDAVIGLMGLHYRHSWFNVDVLLRAARKANWRLGPPFSHVIFEAGDESIELPSLVRVVSDFVHQLEDENIVGFTKTEFVNSLLTAVVRRRDPREFADALKRTLSDRYKRTDKVWLTVAVDHVDTWLKMHPPVRRR